MSKMSKQNMKWLKTKVMGLTLLGLLIAFWFCLPARLFTRPTSFVVEDRQGELLSASIARDGQWRFPETDSVPAKFRKCITAFEDKRFYYHPGLDPISLGRAVVQNVRAGKIVSGGSTISMQVIRLSTRGKRSLANKLLESIRALRLELSFSKDKILSLYASNAPFGSNVVGLSAASWRYFGRPPGQLSWGETASLAVLPNAPSLVHPGRNRDLLLRKRNHLIDILLRQGALDKEEARLAKLEPVPGKPVELPQLSPHLLDLVKKDFARGNLNSTRVLSSLDRHLQQQVNRILLSHHQKLSSNGINNLAALILEVETGKVLAYTGNIYTPEAAEMESHVDVIQARRSPGSTLKPLLYAAMLNEGMLLPNSLVPDIPTQIAGYQPNNYDLGYDGAVPASRALARSLNVPAVKMLQQYKYERFHDLLQKLGITTLNQPPDFYGLSLILGGSEVTMWDLAKVYAHMASSLLSFNSNGKSVGNWNSPSYQLQEPAGKEKTDMQYIFDPAALWYTFEAMNEVMRPGEEQLWQQFSSSGKIAWKTGTSFGFRDAWAIGLNTRYVVAVWAGNTDGEGRPGLTGIDAAAPVLFEIFRMLPVPEKTWFDKPAINTAEIEVCTESGFRASELCSSKRTMRLPKASLKAPACPYNRLIHLDPSETWQVTDACVSPSQMIHKTWFVLPPSMEYYYKIRNYSYKPLPPFKPDCQNSPGTVAAPMELIYPKSNARIYVPLQIDGTRGQIIFNAAHRKTGETVYWHLDDNYLGYTSNLHQMAVNPPPGRHQITLVDKDGNRVVQTFTVLDKEKN